jgi:hypothetical protein
MPLTPAQLVTFKAHLAANTNTINAVAISALPNTVDANQLVADWYNGLALPGDSQPFTAPLNLWAPVVTIQQLNGAINWGQNPAGTGDPAQTNSWLRWQSMCWQNQIDLTDAQVRSGVASVWGTASSTNTAIKAVGVGRKAGTRAELVFAGPSRGPNGNAADADVALNGRVSAFYGQRLDQSDVEAARNLP